MGLRVTRIRLSQMNSARYTIYDRYNRPTVVELDRDDVADIRLVDVAHSERLIVTHQDGTYSVFTSEGSYV